jgi:alanine racemase
MNSGMNRLGFRPEAFRSAWARLNALPQVDEISLMTHFSDADGPRGIAHQVACLRGRHRATCPASAAWQQRRRAAPRRRRGRRAPPPATETLAQTGCAPASCCYGSAPDFPQHDIAHWDLRPR